MTRPADDLPVRGAEGLAALDIFYAGFNDINFYVEDAEQENLYEVILRRRFPDVRVDRIFPLGGKEAVRRHAEEPQNEALPAYRAYILDKDFDDLLGTMSTHPNIFYLDRFCIENYLLEESAFVEVVVESHPKKKRETITNQLQMTPTVDRIFYTLRPLFICFACVQRFDLGLQNCGSAPEMYCHKDRRWELDPAALTRYFEAIKSVGSGFSPPITDPTSDARMADAIALNNHKLVSGKHILCILFHYIKSKFNLGSITLGSFVYRLAKNCSLQHLDQFAASVSAAAAVFASSRASASQ